MNNDTYKKYTIQAKRGIKGEAFFESLVSDYSLPHRIVGPKDLGIDYICEWVYGDRPTGILYAVQIKTFTQKTAKPQFVEIDRKLNGLHKYRIANPNLTIDEKTLHYWQGLGMPVYLFAIVQTSADTGDRERLDCYYKRFTRVLTTNTKQEELDFYKVNDGTSFIAFADPNERKLGFARDLFIDYIKWSYYKGSIVYLKPRTIGLNQFAADDSVFIDILREYSERVCFTYTKTRDFLEKYCQSKNEKEA